MKAHVRAGTEVFAEVSAGGTEGRARRRQGRGAHAAAGKVLPASSKREAAFCEISPERKSRISFEAGALGPRRLRKGARLPGCYVMKQYRYISGSPEGFIQRAVILSQKGYRYFVTGVVPARKTPEEVDEKILSKYELRLTAKERFARKHAGKPNGHYFRYGRTWVVMATSPALFHERDEKEVVLWLEEAPLRAFGYAVSLKRDASRGRLRADVRLDRETYRELRGYFLELALHRSKEKLAAEMWQASSRYQPFAPVHRQFRSLITAINERRKVAGFERVPYSCIRVYRAHPKHFAVGREAQGSPGSEAA